MAATKQRLEVTPHLLDEGFDAESSSTLDTLSSSSTSNYSIYTTNSNPNQMIEELRKQLEEKN